MSITSIAKRLALGLTTLAVGLVMTGGVVHAIPYTGDNTVASPVPAFNVFTGVPAPWGNESDFLRARVDDGSSTDYSDPLANACADGTKFQLRVYVHNGASEAGNNGGSGPSVAHGTKVTVSVPGSEASVFTPSATISATNAATVNDTATINCNGRKVKMTYIAGSASSYSKGTGVVQLSDSIVTSGASIRSQSVPGDVWGCWDDRVYVVLSVTVKAVPQVEESLGKCEGISNYAVDHRNRKVSLKVNGSTTNAEITGYRIDWGDGTTTNNQEDSHTYNDDGPFIIKASVRVKFADGHSEWKMAKDCLKAVAFGDEEVPPVPEILPETGAAGLVGIFSGVSAAGAVAHSYITRRRK